MNSGNYLGRETWSSWRRRSLRGRGRNGRFHLGRGWFFFLGRRVWRVHVHLVIQRLLLERDNAGEIQHRLTFQRGFHELQPDRKSCPRSGFFLTKRNLLVVETHPHSTSQLRREAHEPGVRIVLCRARLSAGWTAKRLSLHARPELNDFLEHRRHRPCDFWRDDVVYFRMRLFEQRPVVCRYSTNHVWVDSDPVVRKHRECGSVLDQLHVRRAQHERQIRRK